ncbi:hypothetical protein LBMAG56_05400 [Verrucomicrobiota bacterium]|nr:hypothetical protein LBMAG56_05400 [Verrucomicrobiota bacterium]
MPDGHPSPTPAKTVFISYSHDSAAHAERVRGLAASLARDGCLCRLDVHKDTDEDWPTWMTRQLLEADFVLCVVTETYERRFRDRELPEIGLGVGWEAGLIRRLLYAKKLHNHRIFPVAFAAPDHDHTPLELQAYDHFQLDTATGYEALLRKILIRPLHTPPATGTPPNLETQPTAPTFPRPGETRFQPTKHCPADLSRIDKYARVELVGREAETEILADAWKKAVRGTKKRPHVITFVAMGGEGKTSLVAKWAIDLQIKQWPGCDAVFAWSFYSQGTREQTAVSSDLFLAEALTFFGDEAMAKSAAGAFDKGRRLARLVGERRALLILDGLEPLQYAPTSPTPGELRDQGLAALLKGLAATSHGLCVVTTRHALPDLRAFLGQTVREEKLTRLARAAGVQLLKAHGVTGSDRPNLPHTGDAGKKEMLSEFEKLVEDVDGHALTLHLLGSYLCDAHGGDIRKVGLVKLEEANPEVQGGHAFHVMDAYVAWLESGAPSIARPEHAATHLPSDARRSNETGPRALALLRLMGLFDRPASADCLAALWKGPAIAGLTEPLIGLSAAQRNIALKRLEEARLLTVNRDAAGTLLSLDAHPLLREYFAQELRAPTGQDKPAQGKRGTSAALGSESKNADRPEGAAHGADVSPLQGLGDSGAAVPGALPQAGMARPVGAETSAAWRSAHRRLYEHLCATTKDQPAATLEDLQPLYQAVAHGCQAGLPQEAYDKVWFARIRKGNDYYSTNKLGAFGSDLGAVACFFETPWSRVSLALKESTQAVALNAAATRLRALGRLTEALEPMRAGLEMRIKQEVWKSAAIIASNLSELELTLGEVAGAVGDAEQSVTYADRSGDASQRMINRTTHADALHQAGRRAEAEARFREAEQMQAERQPAYPLLYSLQGFQYCDLLLTEAERAAWQLCLEFRLQAAGRGTIQSGSANSGAPVLRSVLPAKAGTPNETCRAVSARAAQTLQWVTTQNWLLDIALDHLTLGRAALYAAILEPSEISNLKFEIEAAVSGLRRAGDIEFVARALLTRAWQRSLTGVRTGPESAQSDLDEAWEIAARGPMPLFLADIHLHRARLFGSGVSGLGSGEKYPWHSPAADLAAAAHLIDKHAYHRRDAELADAQRALLAP